jgi:erythromycin esterase-like protein
LAVRPADAQVQDAAAQIAAAVGDRRLVMLGEMHGTTEIPAIAGDLVARWTGGHAQSVLLGLEATTADQARVDRYLASDGTAADRADLLAGEHWTEPMHDGRDSRAIAGLIERLRTLRAAGADVSIAMFDAPGAGERNARMAASLRSAIAAHQGARVLVLTGNVHAMTGEPPEMFSAGKPYKLPTTMARHLADLHPVSINVGAAQGDFWACQDTCGRHLAMQGRHPSIAEPSLERNDPGDTWDYLLMLPRFSASEPAIAHIDAGSR